MQSLSFSGLFNEIRGFEQSLVESGERKIRFFKYFQGLVDGGCNVCALLSSYFCTEIHLLNIQQTKASNDIQKLGLELSKFFIDGYWFEDSKRVLLSCLSLQSEHDLIEPFFFECNVKLLHTYNCLREFENAESLIGKLKYYITMRKLDENEGAYNVSEAYLMFSEYYYFRDKNHCEAFFWCDKALTLLSGSSDELICFDVFCHFAKLYVEKNDFKKAKIFIEQAHTEAKNVFKFKNNLFKSLVETRSLVHPKIIDLLITYAFYLSRQLMFQRAITTYENALKVAQKIFLDDQPVKNSKNYIFTNIFKERDKLIQEARNKK
ncbi:amyloid protein-binding protein 2-like protein [Dinothrombium tinctorium]|uniref:Amyloid protein-binding protein 2-like protein n=1 Tax=Dinothrombium tinctorium TaxID=1965070 RepID=A0A3S3NNG4_9ACAR|nr:amyloid protein-binding protein 2-like protein [Dinothrombium tinctorium]